MKSIRWPDRQHHKTQFIRFKKQSSTIYNFHICCENEIRDAINWLKESSENTILDAIIATDTPIYKFELLDQFVNNKDRFENYFSKYNYLESRYKNDSPNQHQKITSQALINFKTKTTYSQTLSKKYPTLESYLEDNINDLLTAFFKDIQGQFSQHTLLFVAAFYGKINEVKDFTGWFFNQFVKKLKNSRQANLCILSDVKIKIPPYLDSIPITIPDYIHKADAEPIVQQLTKNSAIFMDAALEKDNETIKYDRFKIGLERLSENEIDPKV